MAALAAEADGSEAGGVASVASGAAGERGAKPCQERWCELHEWTPEQDRLLTAAFKRHGAAWGKIVNEVSC